MAKNTILIFVVALLVIHTLLGSVNGLPVPEAGDQSQVAVDSASDLVDLETSANTIIFRPMFLYQLEQKRIKQRLIQRQKLRAQRGQQAANQL